MRRRGPPPRGGMRGGREDSRSPPRRCDSRPRLNASHGHARGGRPGRAPSCSEDDSRAHSPPRQGGNCADSRTPSPDRPHGRVGGGRRRRRRRTRRGHEDGGAGGPERQQEEETTRKVWVAHTDCAKIIGRQGRTMKELEMRSRTRLKVQPEREMDENTRERFVEITGTASEQESAVKLIMELATFCRDHEGNILKSERMPDKDPRLAPDKPTIMEILPQEVGRVIGRGGEMVKKLETESGTKIEVEKSTGKLEIFGPKDCQEKCVELLLAEVSTATAEDGTVLKQPPKRETADGEEVEPDTKPMKIWVKGKEVGKVIGRGGETVRMFMEKTGADIKVQKAEDVKNSSGERQITICGKEEQQQNVFKLILEEVSYCRGVDGILKEPPEDAKRREERKEREAKEAQERARRKAAEEEMALQNRDEAGRSDEAKDGKDKGGQWVCSKCGGDHRSKDCPHSQGLWNMGLRMGMQMGLQAMGMQAMAGMRPPMAGGMPFGMMPGMPPMVPGMGMPPWMMGGPWGGRSRSSGSSSGSFSRSSSSASGDEGLPPGGGGYGGAYASARSRSGRKRRRRQQGDMGRYPIEGAWEGGEQPQVGEEMGRRIKPSSRRVAAVDDEGVGEPQRKRRRRPSPPPGTGAAGSDGRSWEVRPTTRAAPRDPAGPP